MKVNFDFYKEEQDLKQISEEYNEVLEKVLNCKDGDFSNTLETRAKTKNILALSEIRENILNWYSFKENATILEMNANYGEITGMLCKKASRVVSIEQSKKYAKIIEKRHQNKENLELIVGNYNNINLEEKFDYIIILGKPENLKNELEYAEKHLKDEGTILFAVNNKFGVKAWITTKEELKFTNNEKTAITQEQIEKILEGWNYKYYYPLPDYKIPNIIYTESTLPSLADIYRDITYKDENVNFKEVEAFTQIIKNNPLDFKKFANSFLIEISKNEIKNKDIRFVAFSNMRKDIYRIKTIVRKEQVEKTEVNYKSIEHIQNIKRNIEMLNQIGIKTLDSYQNGKIISKYTEAQTLEDELVQIIKEQGKDAFLQKIRDYKDFLKNKLELLEHMPKNNIFTKYKIEITQEQANKLTFVKHGLWDLIFQNCFILEGEYYFYDQEWYEENVPLEYIIYRAILYFHESKIYISDTEAFENLGILELVSIFKKLDDKIQERIRKPLMWNIHTKEELQRNKYTKAKQELIQKDAEIQVLISELKNLKHEHEILKNENMQVITALNTMENSLSWRITKPLRKIKGH